MSILLALAVLAQDPAVAETTPTEAPVETPAPAEKPKVAQNDSIVVTGEQAPENKLTCRMEKPVGSTIKKRVCRTAAQIKAEAAAARSRFGEMRAGQGADEAAAAEVRSN